MIEGKPTSGAMIAAAWLLVALPLGWGVYRSALNAAKLFSAPPTASAQPSAK